MAASDPTTRREAATVAALARVSRMTDDERRAMTERARAALRAADERAVDDEARRLGQYPLDDACRAFRINLRAAVRAKRASDAARAARQALAATGGAARRQGLAEAADS